MGKKGGSAPKAPDPDKTAASEAYWNRVDTFSPNGSGVRYGYTAPDGSFTTDPNAGRTQSAGGGGTVGKSAGGASAGGTTVGGRGPVSGSTGAWSGGENDGRLRQAQMYVESPTEKAIREMLEPASVDFTGRFLEDNVYGMPDPARVQDRGDVADTIYNRTFSLLQPQIERSTDKLVGNLQARGIPLGGDAWNDAYGEHVSQTNDTLSRLAMDADIAAGQEQSRLYGLDAAQRSSAMSELMAVMGGSYEPAQNIPSGNATPVNYSGMVQQNYQNELNAYQQQQQQSMATASVLGSLGGAMIKSSEAWKQRLGPADTEAAARVVTSIPLSGWRYLPEHAPEGDEAVHVGPMAEDFHAMTSLGRPDVIHVADYLGVVISALQNALLRIEVLERDSNRIGVQ